jgi:hypothetical protein
MTFLDWVGQLLEPGVTPEAVRLEIFLLGTRHRGEALSGAMLELQERGLPAQRARLLRAAVDQLSNEAAAE